MLDKTLLGQRIREARERKGLSQEEFAALISRDQRAVSEYEHGKRRISVTDLPLFAEVLSVPILYFYEGEIALTNLDELLLKEFHRLKEQEDQQSAIELLQMFSNAIVRKQS